jgi:hypothetical protein
MDSSLVFSAKVRCSSNPEENGKHSFFFEPAEPYNENAIHISAAVMNVSSNTELFSAVLPGEEIMISFRRVPAISNDAEPAISNDAEPAISNDVEPAILSVEPKTRCGAPLGEGYSTRRK